MLHAAVYVRKRLMPRRRPSTVPSMLRSTYQDSDLIPLAQEVRAAQLPPVAERRRIRSSAGVPVREAAATLGVAPMTLLRWEHGASTPRRENALAYARLLDALRSAVPS